MENRDKMEFDVLIVGGGPAGLSCAIRLKQLAQAAGKDIGVCVIEKAAEIGAHSLSGAVFEPRALNELIPDWKERAAPLLTPAREDKFYMLLQKTALRLPAPKTMCNKGNYIISLGNFCKWLSGVAQEMGVEIYPGFSGSEVLYNVMGEVRGVATGSMGIGRNGEKTSRYQPGVELLAKQTVIAEGCHGSLAKEIIARYDLRKNAQPQTYGLGIKELWEVPPEIHRPGLVLHSVGWPLDQKTYGGSFLYHLEDRKVAVGFVVGLDYKNPYLSPYEEFQKLKHHPMIAKHLKGGRRICYGARALNEGGWQSIPELSFPGGVLTGCSAGFLNVPKIKGTHTAMKSAMLAAESIFAHLQNGDGARVKNYSETVKNSWVGKELHKVRNIRPGFRFGLLAGLVLAAIDTYLFFGKAPWTLRHHKDHESLLPKDRAAPRPSFKPDGVLSFDKMSSVYLSATRHDEDQPCHLRLKDPSLAITLNEAVYGSPESRYCPAGVYEIVGVGKEKRLQINAANCVHCKSCDIKDPGQNIDWVAPQGGEGPNYVYM